VNSSRYDRALPHQPNPVPERPVGAVAAIRGGLVVSCPARPGHPLRDPEIIARLAVCAELGGALGLRLNGSEDIYAARHRTGLPIVGIHKVWDGHRSLITPALEYAYDLRQAGADIIAVDYTAETPGDPSALVAAIREQTDVSTVEEGLAAWQAGADLVGSTLSGYTQAQAGTLPAGPDLELVQALASAGVRVVGEGRYSTPDDVRRAFDAGAWSVVVGTAITDPVQITRRLVAVTPVAAPSS
jgi:N-acylglucosamine-6-phosphate 2-epimerase